MIRAGNGEHYCSAQVAELVDALVSGISDRKIVEAVSYTHLTLPTKA